MKSCERNRCETTFEPGDSLIRWKGFYHDELAFWLMLKWLKLCSIPENLELKIPLTHSHQLLSAPRPPHPSRVQRNVQSTVPLSL